MLKIDGLIWDDWNVRHIARHGVLSQEVREVCSADSSFLKTYSNRIMVVGLTTGGRFLSIVLARKEKGVYYAVTARPSSKKERYYYKEQKKGG